MKIKKLTGVCWILVFSVFWSSGCSLIQSISHENKPPPPPEPFAVEQPPEIFPEPAAPPPPPEVKYYPHTIKWSGENLIRISRWYTGTGNNWLKIVEANPSIDPRRIKIGDTILIPEDLLITRAPMPIDTIIPKTAEKKAPAAPTEQSPPKVDEVELFGPIDTEVTGRIEGVGSPLPLETIE